MPWVSQYLTALALEANAEVDHDGRDPDQSGERVGTYRGPATTDTLIISADGISRFRSQKAQAASVIGARRRISIWPKREIGSDEIVLEFTKRCVFRRTKAEDFAPVFGALRENDSANPILISSKQTVLDTGDSSGITAVNSSLSSFQVGQLGTIRDASALARDGMRFDPGKTCDQIVVCSGPRAQSSGDSAPFQASGTKKISAFGLTGFFTLLLPVRGNNYSSSAWKSLRTMVCTQVLQSVLLMMHPQLNWRQTWRPFCSIKHCPLIPRMLTVASSILSGA
jgi:hypothetical protein